MPGGKNILEMIGKIVSLRSNEECEILEVNGSDISDMNVKISNGKTLKLVIAYKSGYIRFKDETINKMIQDYLDSEKGKNDEREKRLANTNVSTVEVKRREREPIVSFRDEYQFLSNFYSCKVTYDGYTYLNSEAAFQAQKDLTRRNEFTSLSGPSSKRLGKRVNLRKDWEDVKLKIMEEIVKCKFDQNPDLKEKLIDTGDAILIEGNDWGDKYWGVCKGVGENHLGIILMKIRDSYLNN